MPRPYLFSSFRWVYRATRTSIQRTTESRVRLALLQLYDEASADPQHSCLLLAIEAAATKPFELILMDLQMPVVRLSIFLRLLRVLNLCVPLSARWLFCGEGHLRKFWNRRPPVHRRPHRQCRREQPRDCPAGTTVLSSVAHRRFSMLIATFEYRRPQTGFADFLSKPIVRRSSQPNLHQGSRH